MNLIARLRAWWSRPIGRVCECCAEWQAGRGDIYCGACHMILIQGATQGRSLAVWRANRRVLLAGGASAEVRAAMRDALVPPIG